MRLIDSTELKDTMKSILGRAGLPSEDQDVVAESLTQADLRGISSHGLLRLPLYLERLHQGVVKARPKMVVIKEKKATALLDGDHALGQVSGHYAMLLAIKKARDCGVAAVSVKNGHHFGAGAYFVEMASRQDMIGIAMTNTPPLMAPWGGKKAMVGNNPFAVSIPTEGPHPLILDMAFSQVAQGKISVAQACGQEIPGDWATDCEGIPTTNPDEALKGLLLPAGGYKGYGQAIMVDMLTGVLSGSLFGPFVISMMEEPRLPQSSGQLYMAIDISAFRELTDFKKDVARYVEVIKGCPKASLTHELFVPGEQSWQRYEKALTEGIKVPEAIFQELKQAAALHGYAIKEWKKM